jgi:hypothetical protein
MFNVGDKVVCVDDRFDAETASYFSPLPIRGRVYCVRAVGHDVVHGRPAVWVVGVKGRMYIGFRERPLRATRFRRIWTLGITESVRSVCQIPTRNEVTRNGVRSQHQTIRRVIQFDRHP